MLVMRSCIISVISISLLTSAMIHNLQMPGGLQMYFNGAKTRHNLTDVPGEQIFWECMQHVMWQMAEQMGHNITRETRDYLDRLLQVAVDTASTQIPRHRKEYRMLTDDERDRFHKAVLALKQDASLKPNVYTAMAELHAGEVIPMAHFGAGFPGWHRVMLLIFETALRMKDPTVSVPYWASNLDNEMEDPTMSVVWSSGFLGNGDGFVTSGPFADFKVFSTDSVLTRNLGAAGSLMTNAGIHRIWSQNHTAQITNPQAPLSHNLELQHNTVHAWIGGNMDDLSTSAEDPVFFLHHSFVDYLWEEFRTRQKELDINPETDYPTSNWGEKEHAPHSALGFGDLRNIDALSNVFADMVKYDQMPVCSRSRPTCESKYLKCSTSHDPPVCVSLSREDVNNGIDPDNEVCVEARLTRAVQNTFAINQYCDIRKWSYIPVKIVLQRPPEFVNYKAYPVYNNKPFTRTDVFSTISNTVNVTNRPAAYPNCKKTSSVARNIYIESYGLNYYGKYKDFTVLDQRHALSTATTYLGIKTPESNFTDVIVFAYDSCGRTCRTFCRDMTSKTSVSEPCSGVLRITPEEPKLYGDSYAEAVNNVWTASSPDALPEVMLDHAAVTFYCDFSGVWPWDRKIKVSSGEKITRTLRKENPLPIEKKQVRKVNKSKKVLKSNAKIPRDREPKVTIIQSVDSTNVMNDMPNVRVIDLRSATSRTAPRLSRNLNSGTTFNRGTRPLFSSRSLNPGFSNPMTSRGFRGPQVRQECRLNSGCTLPVSCSPCSHKSRQPCRVPSRLVAICVNGVFMMESMFFNLMG